MNILVADPISKDSISKLKRDFVVDQLDIGSTDLSKYEGIIVRSRTKIDVGVIKKSTKLRIIARAGKGYDNIDVEAATERDILVVNVPGGNENAVAEHTIALIFSLLRNIAFADRNFRSGNWVKEDMMGQELDNKVLGLVGYGRVGRLVAEKISSIIKKIVVYDLDPAVKAANHGVKISFVDFEELTKSADIISIHVPKTEKTKNLFNKDVLNSFKPGAYLINTSRGGLVDEDALCGFLKSKKIAGAAFDVFEKEPPDQPLKELYTLSNFVATPHVAGQTVESEQRTGQTVAETVCAYLRDGVIRDAINTYYIDGKRFRAILPYRILVKRLVQFLAQYSFPKTDLISLVFRGDFFEGEKHVLENLILRELLNVLMLEKASGYINARKMAERYKVRWQVEHKEQAGPKSIGLSFSQNSQVNTAAAKIDENGNGLLVQLDNFVLRGASIDGQLLILVNKDIPGIYAKVTSILAEYNLNITEMNTGRSNGLMLAIMNITDGEVSKDVLDKIKQVSQVFMVKKIQIS